MKKIRKAVIPAAGFATRMLPASKSIPKGILPVYDKPILHYIVEEIVESGIRDILIIASKDKGTIQDYFDMSYELEEYLRNKNNELYENLKRISELCNIYCVRQKEKKGLGDAILYAEAFVKDEPFAVLLGDDIVYQENSTPCLKQMMDLYDTYQGSIIGIQEVPKEEVDRYGIISGKLISKDFYEITDMEEKPNPRNAKSNLAISGRYVITPRIFDILKVTKPGKGNEVQLTDALCSLSKEEKIYAYKFDGKRYDVGNKLGYMKASIEFALRDPEISEELFEYMNALTNREEE